MPEQTWPEWIVYVMSEGVIPLLVWAMIFYAIAAGWRAFAVRMGWRQPEPVTLSTFRWRLPTGTEIGGFFKAIPGCLGALALGCFYIVVAYYVIKFLAGLFMFFVRQSPI